VTSKHIGMSQPIEAGRQHLYEKTAHATGSIIMNIAVEANWQAVEAVAEPLVEHYEMTAQQVDAVLAHADIEITAHTIPVKWDGHLGRPTSR
jgi:hypothetical protein